MDATDGDMTIAERVLLACVEAARTAARAELGLASSASDRGDLAMTAMHIYAARRLMAVADGLAASAKEK